MPQRVRPYAATVFLLLALVALPVVAGEQGAAQSPREQGLLVSIWQAVMDLVPSLAQLGRDPLGSDDPKPTPEGDLGPGLDPAG